MSEKLSQVEGARLMDKHEKVLDAAAAFHRAPIGSKREERACEEAMSAQVLTLNGIPVDPREPAVYRRPPAEMSEATRRWCEARWPTFGDNRRIRRACEAYEAPMQEAITRLRRITV